MRWGALALGLLLALGCAGVEAGRPAWERPPAPIRDTPVVPSHRITRATLANGLEILVLEDHRLPQLAMGATFRRGAASEPPERAGLASFLADLIERGAGERDALALARAVDDLGASFSVSADWDSMGVGVSGLSRDFEALFPILVDLVRSPRLDPLEAERERAETLAQLERAKDSPRTLAAWYAARAVYGSHRFGAPVSGTPDTVSELDAEQARRFYEEVFVPGNAILYAVGDVDAADFVERIRAAFADWRASPPIGPGPPPPMPAPAERRVVIVDRPDLGQAQIVLGHAALTRTDDRRIPASVMNTVLGGGGFSSRLMKRIRAEEGLAYGVSSYFDLRRAPGPFVVATATRVDEARRAIDLILEGLNAIADDDPPVGDELRNAQTLAAGRFALGLETSDAVLGSLVNLDVHGLPRDSLDTYRARVAAVTSESARAAARDLLHPERAAIVVVGPAETLTPALAGLGPIEVVEP